MANVREERLQGATLGVGEDPTRLGLADTSIGVWHCANFVDLVGLHGGVLGPVVDEVELSAFVEGATQVGFPLGGVWFIHSFIVFACLFGPGLKDRHSHLYGVGGGGGSSSYLYTDFPPSLKARGRLAMFQV